ncbi:hypothetical protein [Saccharibacillus sacchari]|uniref:hypothetical protein n=1 Tax=Saccharibacillus sacchari TaxID=456493 RepID=UPI0004ACE084|nr:hypothetical protein [Saccharibacillus sacchari]
MRKHKMKKLLKEAYGRLFGQGLQKERQRFATGMMARRGQDWKPLSQEDLKQGWNEELAIDSIRIRL